MIDAGGHVLFFALAAAASPLTLTATLVVLRSRRPRTNGIAFLGGFLVGTTIACGLGLAIGQAAVDRLASHQTFEEVLTLLLGAVLLVAGLRARHASPRPPSQSSRASAILTGLANVRPAAAFSMAGLLGVGGPKRLVLTFLAMASVSDATLGDVAVLTLVVVYIAVATLIVSVPVGIVIVAGDRAAGLLARGHAWLTGHEAWLRVWLSTGIGAALLVDGLVRLVV
ncbi:MAG TPA: GAP family protein [Gaiellales bacterium]|nr:GAP family protein [Gaiellales bacterium]